MGSTTTPLAIILPSIPLRKQSRKATQRRSGHRREISKGGCTKSRRLQSHRSRHPRRPRSTNGGGTAQRIQARGEPQPRPCFQKTACAVRRREAAREAALRRASKASRAASVSPRASWHSSRRHCRSTRRNLGRSGFGPDAELERCVVWACAQGPACIDEFQVRRTIVSDLKCIVERLGQTREIVKICPTMQAGSLLL